MHKAVSYKTKQFFFVVIKLSIVFGACYFIYNRLLQNKNLSFNHFIALLTKNEAFSLKTVCFLILLSGFNWFFEILKWQNLVITIRKISFKAALIQTLGGLTASLITPSRIGDYGAKAMYYPRQYRKRIVLLNLIGNMAQMTVTTTLGIAALLLFTGQYDLDINVYRISRFGLIILVMGAFSLFGLKQSKFKIKGFSINRVIDFIKALPTKTHVLNFSFSFIRYAIFSFQFFILLQLFAIDIDYPTAMIVICSMYFLASIVPSLAVFDVVIKTSAAVYLFGFLGIGELTVLSISTLMWLLNFILPSLFGSYIVLNFKLPKTED